MDSPAWDQAPSFPVPLDILLDIVVHLPLSSVLVLRRTSRSLCEVTRLRSLWAILFRRLVLEQHIPCPGAPLADLSAAELESLARRALTLRQNWTSLEPVARRQLTFSAPSSEPSLRVIFLQFLPARSNRWLISVRMTAQPRTYLLQCWDVACDEPKCVAELKHADGPYGGVVLNSDPSSPSMLALQSAQTETFSINFDATDPESAFETEAVIDGVRELHLLSGSTLVTRHIDDGGPLCIWDLNDLGREKVQLLNPSIVAPDDRVQAIYLAHDYALIIRIQSVEIYSTTPRPNILPAPGAPIAYPLAQFKFPWRTDTVVLSEQHLFSSPTTSSRPRPVHLFVRFGSIYPWPVNVLHHYFLRPNPVYNIWPHARAISPKLAPALSTSTSTHTSGPTATTEYNLPYDPRPSLTQSVSSPVRLFGQSAMALGRYGTALWLDNHAEEWWGGPSERGQRLAGRVFVIPHAERAGRDGNREGRGKEDRVSSASSMIGLDKRPGPSGANIGKPPVAGAEPEHAASASMSAFESESGGASMVFGVRDDDSWTRVAMDEEAGRIAIGHTDGAITLLEY